MGVLRDVLRLDIRSLYLTRSGGRPNALLDFIYKTGARLEMLGQGRHYRVMVFAPVTLWRLWTEPRDTAERLHQLYLRGLWDERGWLARAGLVASALFVGVPLHFIAAVWALAVHGGNARVFGRMLAAAYTHNILGPWFFQYGFDDEAKRARAGEYLHRFELKCGLYHAGNRLLAGNVRHPLNDKARFGELLREAGLLVAADLSGGPLPRADLFLKPKGGRGGAGVVRLDWAEEGWRDAAGQRFDEAGVRALAGGAMIQRRFVTHPAISDLSNGALNTMRILTIRNEAGEPEAVAAVFRMAVGRNKVADNFHAGGIAANVDPATGRLGMASDLGLRRDMGWVARHPDTGGQIYGRELPHWREALALAVATHRLYPARMAVGWDVGLAGEGPVMIEGNGAPDTDIHQRMAGEPMGNGRFGQLLAHHLAPRNGP